MSARLGGALGTAVLFLAGVGATWGATYTTPRALAVGDIYEMRRDNWTAPPGGALYDGDVEPKVDLNTGTDGDNRYYQRHNVVRAWPTDTGYWYTVAEQQPGEPDPAGEQWVDYVPAIDVLGPGRYAVSASYRWSSGRASYPAIYRVHHALGTNEVPRDQRLGTAGFVMIYFNLGEFELRPGSLVRVEDPGSESITFGNMRFKLLAPVPRLDVALRDGWCELRWPTNATDYRLECTDRLNLPESAGWPAEPPSAWQPVNEPVATQGDRFQVFVPLWERTKYFRLVR